MVRIRIRHRLSAPRGALRPDGIDAAAHRSQPCDHGREHGQSRCGALLIAVFVLSLMHSNESRAQTRSLLEVRRDRVVIQQWDMSCGAAALTTILKYQYDEPVTERDIAVEIMRRKEYLANPLIVRARQGYSLLDLQRVAERRHFQGVGLGHLSMDDLIARAPIIVPMKLRGYNHFVVFRGIYHGQVVLADPAWGNRTMGIGAFEHAWLQYPQVGHIGFSVLPSDGSQPPNRLAASAKDVLLAYVVPEIESEHDPSSGAPDTGAVMLAGPALDLPVLPGVLPIAPASPAGQDPASTPGQAGPPLPPEIGRPPPQSIVPAAGLASLPGTSPSPPNAPWLEGAAGAAASVPVAAGQGPAGQAAVAAIASLGSAAPIKATASDVVSSVTAALPQVAPDGQGTTAALQLSSQVLQSGAAAATAAATTIASSATQAVGTVSKEVTDAPPQVLSAATQTADAAARAVGTASKAVTSTAQQLPSANHVASSVHDAVTQATAAAGAATGKQASGSAAGHGAMAAADGTASQHSGGHSQSTDPASTSTSTSTSTHTASSQRPMSGGGISATPTTTVVSVVSSVLPATPSLTAPH
jgi:uncharacterized protein